MRFTLIVRGWIAVVAVSLALGAASQEPEDAGSSRRWMDGAIHEGPRTPSPALFLPVTTLEGAATVLDLGPLEDASRDPSPAQDGSVGPLEIGIERRVPGDRTVPAADADAWTRIAAGRRILTFAVRSQGAAAVRVGLIVSAPPETLLLVHAPGSRDPTEDPLRAADGRRRDRGGAAGRGWSRLLWSAPVPGDTAVVDVVAPAAADVGAIRVRVPRLAHLRTAPGIDPPRPGASLPCERDVACAKGWDRTADAVAHFVYQTDGRSWVCTGTLVNTTSARPHFLTAAHCIDNRRQAASMVLYWLYESRACGGNLYRYRATAGGARFLASTGLPKYGDSPDISLVRLRRSPPDGVFRAGWSAERWTRPSVRGIHHPSGDVKKISTGRLVGTESWVGSGPETHYRVMWRRGAVEGGSSGSALFTAARFPRQYLTGVLTGGPAPTCIPRQDSSLYGRLDVAYPTLQDWLR